ncbi:hypothetical protein K505DRAFT_327299 [Melanomma pulvis-pyrius CBS 109.77]|uniref:Uncharacterized protein n=1 Tax=Melanomma pulvis-pyrius CBS 109.77 TaxID=1314802 RepID=A0A6A6X3N9_9PLEO|nr:hypothetical protein K505DRAFT_327299 [Melanomma pulvis-pyrius CBS 109.77]
MATEYRDLRSAARAQHRIRARNVKYNSFHAIHASDLPSEPSSTSRPPHVQQSHYLPVCIHTECPTQGTADGHALSSFPADLSTAPIATFTGREAYQETGYGGVPHRRHHADRHKDFAKWARQRAALKSEKRIIRDESWRGDVDYFAWADEWIGSLDEIDLYLNFKQYAEIFESRAAFTEYGEAERSEADGTTAEEFAKEGLAVRPPKLRGQYEGGTSEFWWVWHRNLTGCWRFDIGWCHCLVCECEGKEREWCRAVMEKRGCFMDWGEWDPEGVQRYSLARWFKGMLVGGRLCEEEDEEEEGKSVESEVGKEDWDVVSIASSAWTEIGALEDGEVV